MQALARRSFISLSEQNIIDCSGNNSENKYYPLYGLFQFLQLYTETWAAVVEAGK